MHSRSTILLTLVVAAGTYFIGPRFTSTWALAWDAPPFTAVAFSPDGHSVVLGSQAGIEVRSFPQMALKRRLMTELRHVHDLAFAPDGHSFLAAGGAPAEDGAVERHTWPEPQSGSSASTRVNEHADVVYRVAWSPDGSHYATAGGDGICFVFAANSSAPVVRYAGHSRAVLAVVYAPDGKTVCTAGADQTIRVWSSATGDHVRTLDNHVGTINDLSFAPSGDSAEVASPMPHLVSVSDDRTVRLWQPTIGRLVRFQRFSAAPRAMVGSSDGRHLFVACDDGGLRMLDRESLEVVAESSGSAKRTYAIGLHPTGRQLLVAGDSWRIEDVSAFTDAVKQ